MPPDPVLFARLAPALICALLVLGCAAPPPVPDIVIVPPPDLSSPPPVDPLPASAEGSAGPRQGAPEPGPPAAPVASMLDYADRVRTLAVPDAALELSRLAGLPATPAQQFQMALVLLQTRAPGDSGRALQLLQRLQAQDGPEARALQPLARQVAAQLTEQRRLEEQLERQSQQLREAQRRADQLQDRLEALRAIERARPGRTP